MRTVAVFLFVCCCSIEPAFAQAQFPFTARVKAEHVNIRAGQSNNYESIVEVNQGDELVVVGKNYSWYKVNLPEGASIYVKAGYARLISAEVAEVTGDRVNIRARANTNATIVGQLVRGDPFFIKENAGEWLWIRPVAKAQGWVHADLLEFKAARAVLKTPDPGDALARARIEKDAEQRKHAARFARLRAVADDQHEAEGVLERFSASTGNTSFFRLMDADACVAYVQGPAAILEDFIGSRVVVRGTAREDASRDAVMLAVTRIHLAL